MPEELLFIIKFFSRHPDSRTAEDQKQILPFFNHVAQFVEMGIKDADLWKLLMLVGLGFYSPGEEVLSPGEEP